MKPTAEALIRAAPRYLGVPYSELDCQAFVEAALKQIGISENLPGSNAWYRHMTWVGTPEECKASFGRIPKGAFLFILSHNGKEPEKYKPDGIGNASHIGIYTGLSGAEMCDIAIGDGVGDADRYNFGNGAIHSSQSRGSVCTSNFSGKTISGGWNRIGLWDKICYEDIDMGPSDPQGGGKMTATVYAPTGSTVNLRKEPSTQAALVARIPVGAQVTIMDETADWAKIQYNYDQGYMMKAFLKIDQQDPSPAPSSTVQVPRDWLQDVYDKIGDMLKEA